MKRHFRNTENEPDTDYTLCLCSTNARDAISKHLRAPCPQKSNQHMKRKHVYETQSAEKIKGHGREHENR